MAFTKITNSELNSRGATTLPNQPTISAAALKQEFDAPAKEIVAPKFNNLIDELEAETAAANIGIETPTGRIGETIQEVLNDVSTDLKNVEDKVGNINHSELEDAVLKRHSHENKNVLDEFSVSAQGNLLWDGIPVGGGGSNYENLENKPQINGHQLIGNMSDNDLDLASASSVASLASVVGSMSSDLGIAQSRIRNLQEVTTNLSNDKADKSDLGTASSKNSTSVVTDSSDLVESGAVFDVVGWGNKNLLEGFELGNINRTTGAEEASTTIARTINYIPVTAGEEYTISGSITVNLRVFTFNASKTYINSDDTISISSGTGHYTIPSGVSFIRLIGTASGIGSDMQLEVGSTATAYEPYHASVEETLRDANLINGKNKLQIPDSVVTTTIQGITFTVNRDSDGEVTSIVANGTANNDATLFLYTSVNLSAYNGYKLTGCPSDGGRNKYILCIQRNTSPYTEYATDLGNSANIENVPDDNNIQFFIRIKSGQTVSNLTFYPMISKDGGEYEPYYVPLKDVVPTKADNSVIGTVEDGANPTKSYAVGEHMTRGGKFCTVTSPVTTSSTWILGSNYVEGTIADNLVYKAGDTILISSNNRQFPLSGYLTSSAKQLYFSVPLNRPLAKGVTISFSNTSSILVRGISGYILNDSPLSNFNITVKDIFDLGILFCIENTDASAFNGSNNTAINVALKNCSIILS